MFAMTPTVQPYCTSLLQCPAVMLSLRGQVGLEDKILSSSFSKICSRPRPWPRVFVFDMSLNFLLGPCEIAFNASVDNISWTNSSTSLYYDHSLLFAVLYLYCDVETMQVYSIQQAV